MSSEVEAFMQQLGIAETDFKVPRTALTELETNESYYGALRGITGYLGSVARQGGRHYYEVDQHDSPNNCLMQAYVAPLNSFFEDSGEGHLRNWVRVITCEDSFGDNEKRQLNSNSFVLNPFALGRGIKWQRQVFALGYNDDGKVWWPSVTSDTPKITRAYGDTDRKLGPANITLSLGARSESDLRPLSIDQQSQKVTAALCLQNLMCSFNIHTRVPLGSVKMVRR